MSSQLTDWGTLSATEQLAAADEAALVTSIADIPAALTAVMKLNATEPDFSGRRNLSLKPWLANDQQIVLPPELALLPIRAMEPYDQQIDALSRQIGAVVPRQSMRNNRARR